METQLTVYLWSPIRKQFEIVAHVQDNRDFELSEYHTLYKITRFQQADHTFINIYLQPSTYDAITEGVA